MIEAALMRLQVWREHPCEVIVVDGGSQDRTLEIAEQHADKLIRSGPGRSTQMNAGAELASGEILLFLHADSHIPHTAWQNLLDAEKKMPIQWGFFAIQLDSQNLLLRVVSKLMNWRSRITAIGTGDQCLFVRRELFERLGGFAELPLMEDVEICKRLRKTSAPRIIKERVLTSARRWQANGICRTILLMWRLRLYYFLGVSPQRLHREYYKAS